MCSSISYILEDSYKIDEASYISHTYGRCSLWPCPCQQWQAKIHKYDMSINLACKNWVPCEDKSWEEMIRRLRK